MLSYSWTCPKARVLVGPEPAQRFIGRSNQERAGDVECEEGDGGNAFSAFRIGCRRQLWDTKMATWADQTLVMAPKMVAMV